MNKKKIIVSSLMTLLAAGLTGSIMGTVAWYSYSNRAVAEFTGTSINTSKNLKVGIYDTTVTAADMVAAGFKADTTAGYYFADVDEDGTQENSMPLTPGMIKAYLDLTYYAKNQKLTPVSSGPVAANAGMTKLYKPYGGTNAVESTVPAKAESGAEQKYADFVALPLVLKIVDEENSTSTSEALVKGAPIYLTAIESVNASTTSNTLYKGLRVNLDNGTNKYLVNPSEKEDSSINVGGCLDLDLDGYYDFEGNSFSWTTDRGNERVYGWTEETVTYKSTTDETSGITTPVRYTEDSTLTGTASVHNAKHAKGAIIPEFDASKQYYVGTKKVTSYFDYNGNAFYTDSSKTTAATPIATTDTTTGYATLTATIWLEGWDTNVIDANQPYAYNLGLQFECAYGL